MFGGFYPVGIVRALFRGSRVLERVSLSALGLCLPVGSGVFAGTVLFQCFLLESLILAQDERWRRA